MFTNRKTGTINYTAILQLQYVKKYILFHTILIYVYKTHKKNDRVRERERERPRARTVIRLNISTPRFNLLRLSERFSSPDVLTKSIFLKITLLLNSNQYCQKGVPISRQQVRSRRTFPLINIVSIYVCVCVCVGRYDRRGMENCDREKYVQLWLMFYGVGGKEMYKRIVYN